MRFYIAVGVLSIVLFPLAYRRSGSMTRYVAGTGAPLVWLLLAFAAASAALAEGARSDGTSQAVFAGGLIGTAFVQVVLVRHDAKQRRLEPPTRDDAGPSGQTPADPPGDTAPDEQTGVAP